MNDTWMMGIVPIPSATQFPSSVSSSIEKEIDSIRGIQEDVVHLGNPAAWGFIDEYASLLFGYGFHDAVNTMRRLAQTRCNISVNQFSDGDMVVAHKIRSQCSGALLVYSVSGRRFRQV